MIRFSKLFFGFTVFVLLLWLLPWAYNFVFYKPERTPFTLWSCVVGDFAVVDFAGDGIVRRDRGGRTYTDREFDSILPTFYARQLLNDERFPDSLCGVAVTPRLLQSENFMFRSTPAEINKPRTGLYPLLESMSGRVDLEMPDDVFRITSSGIEFVVMATNRIDRGKSDRFTEAMTRKGFRFPALAVAGNPSTRKEYDEGYLLLDASRQLFHLKQVKGRPYVRAIDLPEGVQPEHLFVTEFPSHRTLGFLTDTENGFHVLSKPSYEIVRVGIPGWNPESESLTVIGNMFDWTVRVTGAGADRYYAVDARREYRLIDSMVYGSERTPLPGLVFTSYDDGYVKPRFE